ncbi:IQ calmodulin-binding motif-containing protein 1 [Pelodytes ibericus]
MTDSVDSRLLDLAGEITESGTVDVPVLLLKLKDFLKSVPPGSEELKSLKEDMYNYDLIQYCVLVMKQDYNRVRGNWTTAANLAGILSNCCVGLHPKTDPDDAFYSKLLPSAVTNMLILARRIQARYVRLVREEEIGELFRSFKMVTDSLCWLFSGHLQLTNIVLHQDHFLQLLMTDDVETGTVVMSMLQNVLRVNSGVLSQVPESVLHPIVDELVYKLSGSTNPVIGIAATRSLLKMLESNPNIQKTMGVRYKGLQLLLSKQWTGKGFGRELGHLLDLLYSGSYQQEEMQRLHNAACTIQAVWRAFQIRNQLRRLPKAVTTLQRSFRAKREQEMSRLKRLKEQEDLRQQLHLQRLRAMRGFNEKQLTLLEIVHAGQMNKHIEEVQVKAALEIQKHWRGYRERKNFLRQRLLLKQYKAAVTIQRAALRFLKKRRKIRDSFSPWKKVRDLNDEQRLILQQRIDCHIQLHPAQQRSLEESKELHVHTQEKLGQYLLKWKLEQEVEHRRKVLLARINTDFNMLMGAPRLTEATEKDVDLFSSRSVPVALKAKQSHSTMLKRSRWPWWKKLSDEFIEDEDLLLNENPDMESGIMFIAGTKNAPKQSLQTP